MPADAGQAVPALDERALVAAVLAGSQAAFNQLMGLHQRTCAQIIGRMVCDRQLVADLLQETFLLAFRQLHRFRFESSLRTWISRLAYTTALQYLRRHRRQAQWLVELDEQQVPQAEDPGMPPDLLGHQLQLGHWLTQALERLTPVQRLVVHMHYVQDFDIADIVQVTAMPSGTIKSHLYRARQVLKTELLRRAPAGELL